MGEVSNGDSMGREMRFIILSGVSEATRSERHQGNLGDPRLGWVTPAGDNVDKETKRH